jgi:hypothetical protein
MALHRSQRDSAAAEAASLTRELQERRARNDADVREDDWVSARGVAVPPPSPTKIHTPNHHNHHPGFCVCVCGGGGEGRGVASTIGYLHAKSVCGSIRVGSDVAISPVKLRLFSI